MSGSSSTEENQMELIPEQESIEELQLEEEPIISSPDTPEVEPKAELQEEVEVVYSDSDDYVEETVEPIVTQDTPKVTQIASAPAENVKMDEKAIKTAEETEELDVGDPFTALLSSLETHPFYEPLYNLILWRDVVKTGLVFGIVVFFFFLVTFGEYSVLTLTSYVLLALLAVCFAYTRIQQARGLPNPFEERLKMFTLKVPRDVVEAHVESLYGSWEAIRAICRSIFYCTNAALSLKAAGVLVVFAILGKIMDGGVLLFLEFLFLFTWPRLYEEKKADINAMYAKLSGIVEEKMVMVRDKLPLDKFLGKKKKAE